MDNIHIYLILRQMQIKSSNVIMKLNCPNKRTEGKCPGAYKQLTPQEYNKKNVSLQVTKKN